MIPGAALRWVARQSIGTINIGIDTEAIPNPRQITELFETSIAELEKLAGGDMPAPRQHTRKSAIQPDA